MEPKDWTPPPIVLPADNTWQPKPHRRGLVAGAALVGVGIVAGAIVGTTVLSGAATTNPTPSASTVPGKHDGHGPGRGMGLRLSGTVTSVGAASVTIKTSTATTTYKVDSNSDIDKNGEAKLADLKAGDAVRFSVSSGNVIDKLHAGDEALDRPQGPRPGDDGGAETP
ncbi:MAG: hypothetical protein ABI140_10670 [Jatrophihabitantaceae bacterium]